MVVVGAVIIIPRGAIVTFSIVIVVAYETTVGTQFNVVVAGVVADIDCQ